MAKLNRGDTFEKVEIIDIAEGGKAIGKVDGMVIFVNGAVPGDIVDVIITKVKRRYFEGQIKAFHKKSESRTKPHCQHFGICGGCKWQHMNYSEQLLFKQKQVTDNFKRIGKIEIAEINPIISSEEVYFYRNKLEYTFSNKRWLTNEEFKTENEAPYNMNGLGFHIPGQFSKVLNIENCYLQSEPSNDIRLAVRQFALNNDLSFFDLKEQNGLLRNLIIRNSNQNDLMVIVVFHYKDDEKINLLLNYLSDRFPQITSLMYIINPKRNDTISDLDILLYKGNDFLTEKMENLTFKIGPKSFFQTNSKQAYVLYKVVKEFASLKITDIVYDLYTGTGTIGIFLAPIVKKVVGIEYIEQAIENARENSSLNHQKNTVFIAGVMEKILDDDFVTKHGKPDIIITDPPRSGMHPKVIEQLLKINPEKIVYVSCNPATQARDIALLHETYSVAKIQAVDMFPHTEHIENVALLIRK